MKYDIKKETALLKETGKLSTHPHIHCVMCESKTTAFGSNLQGKIKKVGSLEKLLLGFECRNCRNAGKPVVVKISTGMKSKRKPKELRTSELLKNPPKMEFKPRVRMSLLKHPELAADVTSISCQRPDIFLDSQRSCDFCNLYQVCKAPNRKLSKAGWQVKELVSK
jgi:hypothetical protein